MLSLNNYEDWKRCISVDCDIPLTLEYVEKRLKSLRDPSDYGTQKFVRAWGDDHLAQVIRWFEQAEQELG